MPSMASVLPKARFIDAGLLIPWLSIESYSFKAVLFGSLSSMVSYRRAVLYLGRSLMRAELWKIWRFGLVGVVNTAVGLTVIYGLKYFGGVGDVWANMGGYGVGLTVSFILNSSWTFESSPWSSWVVVKYLFAFGFAYGTNLATVLFALHMLELNSYLAQAFGLPVYTVLFYCLCRWAVFPPLTMVASEQSDQ